MMIFSCSKLHPHHIPHSFSKSSIFFTSFLGLTWIHIIFGPSYQLLNFVWTVGGGSSLPKWLVQAVALFDLRALVSWWLDCGKSSPFMAQQFRWTWKFIKFTHFYGGWMVVISWCLMIFWAMAGEFIQKFWVLNPLELGVHRAGSTKLL